MEIDLIRINNK